MNNEDTALGLSKCFFNAIIEMNKGKSFEQLVHIIQESLKEHPNIKVSPNVRLKSKTGQYRQFDVIVETIVNGYRMRIAIECKDHGRKTEAKDVEAFHAKCNIVEDINLKVFISKAGFQDSAFGSAKYYGIKLHVLEEGTSDMVLQWINPGAYYDLKMSVNIEKIDGVLVGAKKDAPKKPIEYTDKVYYMDGQESTYIEFLNWVVQNSDVLKKVKSTLTFLSPHLKDQGTLHDPHPVEISTEFNAPYAYLMLNEKRIFFAKVTLQLTVTVIEEKIIPDVKVMRDATDSEIMASVITLPYGNDGSKLQTVIDAKTNNFKSYIINPDGSIRHELKTLATYDPKTQEYSLPNGEKLGS